jgi:twitching motility protein PilU
MMNTKFVGELIERGDFNGVRDAMEKSMTPGSQTFEQDLARMVLNGSVSREEALQHADSASNLMWRLRNDSAGAAGAVPAPAGSAAKDRPDTNPSHPGPASAAPSTSGARPPQFPELSG